MKEEKQLTQSARDYAVYVGDVALDEYYRTPRWPSVADKVEVQTLEAIPGGMIANAACVYAALGNQVKFCTVLRHSPITELLLKDPCDLILQVPWQYRDCFEEQEGKHCRRLAAVIAHVI